MTGDNSRLLVLEITWTKTGPALWAAELDGETAELRMNDFPDEPLFTVKFKGQSLDVDDPPALWVIPYE